MRSLLIKDLVMFRKVLLADALATLLISILFRSPGVIAIVAIIFLTQSIQIDARAHSDVLVNSLPVSRGAVVRSRYAETMVVTLAMFFLAELVAAGLRSMRLTEFPAMSWAQLGSVATVTLVWSAIIVPLYFWLGLMFVRYLSILVVAIVFGIKAADVGLRTVISSASTGWMKPLWAWDQALAAGEALAWVYLLLTAAVLFVGSMLLSVRLYQRREF
ncbi:MAG TPA: ABC-2 transporter permease [Alicyclobacillus sp.]|nr:ABC-2 transporter permease [Alicyclobacillus sp.]